MSLVEANKLMRKYIKLRAKMLELNNQNAIQEFKKHEQLCIEKFKYLVLMKTSRYKNFHNYDDLNQEGLVALCKAMNSYNPNKGHWFWWVHKYIDTRIARCANLHTAIRFPLKYAKKTAPHRESILPTLIDHIAGPQDILENTEALKAVNATFNKLPDNQKQIVKMLFGIGDEQQHSISKICQKLKISRTMCVNTVDQVLDTLRQNIQL